MTASPDQFSLQGRFGGPADLFEAALEGDAIIAAVGLGREVELDDARERIGHLRFRDQVAAAEFDGVDAEVVRRHVEQPLAKEVRFEPARPAIGADRGLVGDEERHPHVDVGNAIRSRQDLRRVACAGRAIGADIGADIGLGMAAQREDGAVGVAGDLQLAGDVAGMVGGDEMLPAVLDPFHRTAGQARGERNEEILGVEFAADAEAAADVVFHHADRGFRQSHLLRQDAAVGERHLGRPMNGEPAVLPFGDKAAQLHRHRRVALHLEPLPAHIGGGAKGSVGVALHRGQGAGEIRAGRCEQRGAALGHRAIRQHGQRRDVDRNRLARILGERGAVRHHHGHGLADIAYPVGRDDGLLERPEGFELLLAQRNGRDAADVGRGDDRMDAGPRQRRASVDRDDAAMGERAAQDHRMQQPRPRDVIDILALAAQEPQILDALDRASDQRIRRAGDMPRVHGIIFRLPAHRQSERLGCKEPTWSPAPLRRPQMLQ